MLKAKLVLMTEENNEPLVRMRLDRLLSALERTGLAKVYGFVFVKRDVEEWKDE